MRRTTRQQSSWRTHCLMHNKRPQRRGFSLLEVLLASAILLGAVIVLGELAHLGIRNAAAARDLTTAELICRSTMNEIVAGILPADEVEDAVVTSMPGWVYSVEVVPLEHAGVSALRVTVAADLPDEQRPLTFSLMRWVPASRDGHLTGALGTGDFGGSALPSRPTFDDGRSRGGP